MSVSDSISRNEPHISSHKIVLIIIWVFLIIKAQWSFLVFDPSPEPSHRRTGHSRAGRAHNTQTLVSILSRIKVIMFDLNIL